MRNRSISEEQLRKIEKIINEIKRKSRDGNYIYRGEGKEHCKVSSALYREHMKYYKHAKNHEYVKNYYESNNQESFIQVTLKDFDLRIVQRQKLQAAKKHIGESPQDIYEDHRQSITSLDPELILTADEIEILTELQHYGDKTNLIDFTTDYLIAIYFACAGESKENGRVIVLEKTEDIENMIIRPYSPRHRVVAQKSIFLYPRKGFVDVPDVNIVPIPEHLKRPMILYLRKHHDLSAATIYNDLHGFITSENKRQDSKREFHLGLAFHNGGLHTENITHSKELYNVAIKHYDSAIELDSEDSDSYYNRGECLLHLGHLDQAKTDIKTAKDMGVDIISAFHNEYKDVADFKSKTDIDLPPDIAEMLGG